jgi:CRISPR-associated endonuclease/helicase Cas3
MGRPKASLSSGDGLIALRRYVEKMEQASDPVVQRARDELFYTAYRVPLKAFSEADFIFCDAPTGSGKTIALPTLASRLAKHLSLPRVVVALPYLVTCRQSTKLMRKLVAEAGIVVAEDTSGTPRDEDFRDQSWQCGMTVISSVAFLEMLNHLSENRSEKWRLLHNAVIILDDCCQWLSPELSAYVLVRLLELRNQGARIIFSSATLPKYWEMPEIEMLLGRRVKVESLSIGSEISNRLSNRVAINRLPRALNFAGVAKLALEHRRLGSGLIVVNTVATTVRLAATLNHSLSDHYRVLCISRLLCPYDKRRMENLIKDLLQNPKDPVLVVATSCVEAGWDVSFPWGMREESWISNLLQLVGRVNRHSEFGTNAPVYSFQLADPLVRDNPELRQQITCFQAIAAKPGSIRASAVTSVTHRLMTDFAPRLLTNAKALVSALKSGDTEYIRTHARLIKGLKTHCFGPIHKLPEAVKRRLSDERGLVIDAELARTLDAYRIEVSSTIFEKLPWKFEMKIIDGEPWYFLRPEEYDPEKGGAQIDR